MNRARASKPPLLALLLCVLGAVLFFAYQRRFVAERSGGEPVAVVVAKKTIAKGAVLVEEALTTREIPLAYVEDRAIKAADRDRILGLRIRNGVVAGQSLFWSDVGDVVQERRDLSSLVTPGNRGVYIRAMREDSGSALILPGDYVDVVATVPPSDQPHGDGVSVLLLQRVLVLANGIKTSPDEAAADKEDKRSPSMREQGLTLSLSLQEAQMVALVSDRGTFTVALRNPDDRRTFDGLADMPPQVLFDGRARAAIQAGALTLSMAAAASAGAAAGAKTP